MFKSIIHISLTALLVFSILAPSFVELISDIEIVEIADINDKEKKEKLEKDNNGDIITNEIIFLLRVP